MDDRWIGLELIDFILIQCKLSLRPACTFSVLPRHAILLGRRQSFNLTAKTNEHLTPELRIVRYISHFMGYVIRPFQPSLQLKTRLFSRLSHNHNKREDVTTDSKNSLGIGRVPITDTQLDPHKHDPFVLIGT